MPKGFSPEQQISIRGRLIAGAKEALKVTGVRKTTVESLAKLANISTGAFYLFYPSKEALFFDLYTRLENKLKQDFLQALQKASTLSPATIRQALVNLVLSDDMDNLLRILRKDELDYIVRSIDTETIQAHLQDDQKYLAQVMDYLAQNEITVTLPPDVLLMYLQAMFMLCYEKEPLAPHFERIMGSFIDTLIREGISPLE